MTYTRSKSYGLLILCLLLMLLAGCGKKDKDSVATPQDATTTSAPTTVVTTEEKKADADGFYIVNDYVTPERNVAEIMIKPSEGSGIYRYLSADEIVNRTGYNDIWSRVVVDNTDFYVMSEQIKKSEAPKRKEEEGDLSEEEAEEVKELPKKVVIDAGNQSQDNILTEPIGPDTEITKKSVSAGSVGTTYDTKEYEINLVYANKLKEELEKRGYEVFMTRDSNDVDISNKARAQYANSTGATVFVRIQMGFSSNKELSGAMVLTMTNTSPYNAVLYDDSHYLATRIMQGIILKTGVTNQGIYETDEMTAINWSEIPVAVIKLGFLSNSIDEANLLDEDYQAKMVEGIADGIDSYISN